VRDAHASACVSSFTPNDDPSLPGGVGRLYVLNYLTGEAVFDFGGGELMRSDVIGGGIPSKPVMVITEEGQRLFLSIGGANPEDESEEVGVVDTAVIDT